MKISKSILFTLLSVFYLNSMIGQMIILSGPEKGSYNYIVNDMIKVCDNDSIGDIKNIPSSGSAFNFDQLVDPNTPVKMVMIQSDYLYYQAMLDNKNNTKKTASLSILMPLAYEEIHVVTRDEKRLNKLGDLFEKNVACGTENEGTFATATFMKDRSRVFWNTKLIPYPQALKELLGRQIDAFIIVGSAPLELLNVNPQSLVTQIAIMNLDNVNDWAEFYTPRMIKAGTYKWQTSDVNTFGVRTVLLVNESKLTADDRIFIDRFTQSVKSNYVKLVESGHPSWIEVNFADWDPTDWRLYTK
jgi:TRAP transporter TAXI family solute receptor